MIFGMTARKFYEIKLNCLEEERHQFHKDSTKN